MTILEFFMLMGGVGLFLYGMSMMSTGLKNAAGDKLKTILEKATSNRFMAVIVGLLVTLLIQSSSATDMMVISFVNSGFMTLAQAVGVIMGANIGTTITAQITAFNLGAYAPMILFIGTVMYIFMKKDTVKYVGTIIMGFGMLFFGISVIKSAIAPLAESEQFISFLSTLSNPAVAVVFGILFTALLQSSSSSVVIFQTFAVQGIIGYEMTVYLVIGAAIGSVAPNILASLTTNRNGKRTAVLNLLFNVIRAAIMILLINIFPGFLRLIQSISPDSIGHQVANTHTIFAIIAVILEFPIAGLLVVLSKKIIPVKCEESKALEERKLHYIISNADLPTAVSISHARMEIVRMGHISLSSLRDSVKVVMEYDEGLAESVIQAEETVDHLTDKITDYLLEIKSQYCSAREIARISQMVLAVANIERISDHAENIVDYGTYMKNKKVKLSDTAKVELQKLADASMSTVALSLEIFENLNVEDVAEVERREQMADDILRDITKSHIKRLVDETCSAEGGIIFTDMSIDLERCSDHAVNVAYALVDENGKLI